MRTTELGLMGLPRVYHITPNPSKDSPLDGWIYYGHHKKKGENHFQTYQFCNGGIGDFKTCKHIPPWVKWDSNMFHSHEMIELCKINQNKYRKTIYKSPTNSNHLSSKPSTLDSLDQCGTPFVHHLFWGCSRHWLCLAALGWNFGRTRHRRHWCFLNCLVVDLPLKNMSQLGWWHSQYDGKNGKFSKPPTSQDSRCASCDKAKCNCFDWPYQYCVAHGFANKLATTPKQRLNLEHDDSMSK